MFAFRVFFPCALARKIQIIKVDWSKKFDKIPDISVEILSEKRSK